MLNFDYADGLMRKLELQTDEIAFFDRMAGGILSDARHNADVEEICALLAECPAEFETISARCDELSQKTGYHEYAITAFVFLAAADRLHDAFRTRGIADAVFYNTVDDLRCKLNECRAVYGMHGCFVREWLFAFFKMKRFGLGRLCFELNTWRGEPVLCGEHALLPGEEFIGFHIPTSGRAFDKAVRQAAYEEALAFFGDHFTAPVVPIVCTSWLLDPMHRFWLPERSNIRDFANDFDIVIGRKVEKFTNAWRIFADKAELPPEKLPENSKLQKTYKARLIRCDTFYNGCGIMWKNR